MSYKCQVLSNVYSTVMLRTVTFKRVGVIDFLTIFTLTHSKKNWNWLPKLYNILSK